MAWQHSSPEDVLEILPLNGSVPMPVDVCDVRPGVYLDETCSKEQGNYYAVTSNAKWMGGMRVVASSRSV